MSLGGYTPFEKRISHLVASCHVREPDGEIGFAVMDEVQFLAFHFRQCGVYPTFLQVAEQCGVREFLYLQALKTFLGGLFLESVIGWSDMECLPSNLFQQVRHIVGTVEFLRQCDDVATFACSEVIPLIEFGVYLERCFRFLPERGLVPKAVAMPFDRAI